MWGLETRESGSGGEEEWQGCKFEGGEAGEWERIRRRRAWFGIREGEGGKGRLVTGQVRLPESSQRWMEARSKV